MPLAHGRSDGRWGLSMSRRERPASGVAELFTRPAGEVGALRPELKSTGEGSARAPGWEEIFLGASSNQQSELLDLAHRQGVLYAHQLPAPPNGARIEHGRQVLLRLLAGHIDHL